MTEPTDGQEPIKVFTAEHCVPCHEIVDLLKQKRFASDVVAPVDLVDIETEEGFASVKEEELEGVPSATYKGKTCKLEVDEEMGILLISCEGEEELKEGATATEEGEEEGTPT